MVLRDVLFWSELDAEPEFFECELEELLLDDDDFFRGLLFSYSCVITSPSSPICCSKNSTVSISHDTTRAEEKKEKKRRKKRGRGRKKARPSPYLEVLHGKAQVVIFRVVVVLGTRSSDQVLDIRRGDGAGREAQGELECLQLFILPALHFWFVLGKVYCCCGCCIICSSSGLGGL